MKNSKSEFENKYFYLNESRKTSLKCTLKRFAQNVARVHYGLRMRLLKPKDNAERKYKVAILSIFKNEANYLCEWIEFHKIVGVEHFYLYNNNSTDDYLSVLTPYIEQGLVTLVQWPYAQGQLSCYKDGIAKYKGEAEWIALIDIDEFIVPNSTDNIYDFLKDFKNRPAVVVYTKFFGSAGKIDRDVSGLVTENFTVCWDKFYRSGKCFFNTRYDYDADYKRNFIANHSLWANVKGKPLPPVNLFGKIDYGIAPHVPKNADPSNFPMQVNHYCNMSYKEYLVRITRGDAFFKDNPRNTEKFFSNEIRCGVYDVKIYKYLVKLKLALGIEQ